MKNRICVLAIALTLLMAVTVLAQESGFIISMKNGSQIRGRMLTRDETTGNLRLTMTETSGGAPKSYAIISMEDAETIRPSNTESDSIRIKLRGGSELRCKEFSINGDVINVKLGAASRVDVSWDQIESISFAP
ncbi:MAG TPA: hypothetical protein VF131_13660 [Blastocatellia bacterium]|nr:hypothetical protein [Blastocatellia bacterium]